MAVLVVAPPQDAGFLGSGLGSGSGSSALALQAYTCSSDCVCVWTYLWRPGEQQRDGQVSGAVRSFSWMLQVEKTPA